MQYTRSSIADCRASNGERLAEAAAQGDVVSRSVQRNQPSGRRGHRETSHALDDDTATGVVRKVADSADALGVRGPVDAEVAATSEVLPPLSRAGHPGSRSPRRDHVGIPASLPKEREVS